MDGYYQDQASAVLAFLYYGVLRPGVRFGLQSGSTIM